jgi:tetratricopeptide (TPR) repeat protein
VAAHLLECARCRDELAAFEETRSYFDEPPPLAAEAAAAIRFRLEAAARAARPAVERRPARRGLWTIAAIVLGGAVAVAWLAWPATVHRAAVHASSGAAYERVAAEPDEVYRVREGTVTFDVPPLGRDRRFRVLVGSERVEVHGTRFRVTAEHDRLESVAVDEGVVSLLLDDGSERLLSAGSRYDRAELVANRIAEPRIAPRPADRTAEVVRERGEQTSTAHEPPRRPERDAARRVPRAQGDDRSVREGAPSDPSPAVAPAPDGAFQEAWALHRAGDHDAAARAFDALLERAGLGGRRADVLYWSARSHDAAGRTAIARARFDELVRAHPDAWHAADARLRLARMSPSP